MTTADDDTSTDRPAMPAIVIRCLLQIVGVAIFDIMINVVLLNTFYSYLIGRSSVWLFLIFQVLLYAAIILGILMRGAWASWLIGLPIVYGLLALILESGSHAALYVLRVGLLGNALYELVTDQEAIAWLNPIEMSLHESAPSITESDPALRSPKPKTTKKSKSKSVLLSKTFENEPADLSGNISKNVSDSEENLFYRSANFHAIVAFITFVLFPIVGFFWLPVVWTGKNQFFVWRNSQVEIETMSPNARIWITGAVITNFLFWSFVNKYFG